MATTPFQTSAGNGTALFDIYTDNGLGTNNFQALPSGACNFVDLTPGANGSKCGCRRFWTRQSPGSPVMDQSGWCMCNHHACYHEHIGGAQDNRENTAGQENEKPRTGRDPLSPVVDVSFKAPSSVTTFPGLEFPAVASTIAPTGAQSLFPNVQPQDSRVHPSIRANLQTDASMPDTMDWVDPVQSQLGLYTLPPIPSQCLIPSQTASAASSVRNRYLRPFAGKGLQTLQGMDRSNVASMSQKQPEPVTQKNPRDGATTMENSFVLVDQDQDNEALTRPSTAVQAESASLGPGLISQTAFKNLSETVSGHEERLDKLETVSFSATVHDDCQDKHEHTDLRVTDLESRVEEVERLVNDNGSVIERRNDRQDDGTTQSIISNSTTMTSRALHSQELYSQVQELQAQVAQFRSFMPSPSHNWEVEVVFLPFPLKRLWQEIHQFKSDPSLSNDDWTQLPMTHSTSTLRSQSPFYGDWATADHDAEWLLPRACGDSSVTDKRLRSRGLVKTVHVKGPDARSVQLAMNVAFGEVFQEMQIAALPQHDDPRCAKYLGLQSSWVPLRKIHKDSRLRFLSPAEMVTPVMWDVQFLSSVMMRSSEPRLFVTHPDAYLQDYQSYETGWTWQRLRELSRVYPELEEDSQDVPEADALEDYWTWNENLDEAPNVQTSMSMRHNRQRVSISPSQHYLPALSWPSSSPALTRGQSPMVKGRRGSRPPPIRTTSMPLSAGVEPTPATARRRIVSHGQSRRSSPSVRAPSQAAILKRRRTRSPSYPRFTPRWTASPSPGPPVLVERQRQRGATPLAYATPYSNAPLQEIRPMQGSDAALFATEYSTDNGDDAQADEDFDIDIYESASEESFGDHESDGSLEVPNAQPVGASRDGIMHWQLPEDEPWPGIEDQQRLSDGENMDPQQVARSRRNSNASSQPSEYPTGEGNVWPTNGPAFAIHEDDDNVSEDDDDQEADMP